MSRRPYSVSNNFTAGNGGRKGAVTRRNFGLAERARRRLGDLSLPIITISFSTEQEAFWAGNFGNEYAERNVGQKLVAANCRLFAEILTHTSKVGSVLELGCNIGLNLMALQTLLPEAKLSAVEINESAAAKVRQALPAVELTCGSILEFDRPGTQFDLVFTKGVMIHIHPEKLPAVYDKMFALSSRYILVVEYYNSQPVEVPYRGHAGRLFKRDFAGELLERFPSLRLVSYGFIYRRDPMFPQDDMTWFLLEKR